MSIRLRRICCAIALAGCGGHTLDVGSTDGGPASGDLGRDAGASSPSGPVWNGTLENAQLADGSNRLTMTLSVAADGSATGTLLLGDGTLLQPPTDPNVGYPSGAIFAMGGPLGFFEGFAYTMLDGRLTGTSLTFRVAELELWTQWCKLQTKTYSWGSDFETDAGPFYSCEPDQGVAGAPMGCSLQDPGTMTDMPIDCGKWELCFFDAPCTCSATGCQVRPSTQPDLTIDLTVTGATADGTISGLLGDHDVHFVRAQ
jgi:hypothetical protein